MGQTLDVTEIQAYFRVVASDEAVRTRQSFANTCNDLWFGRQRAD